MADFPHYWHLWHPGSPPSLQLHSPNFLPFMSFLWNVGGSLPDHILFAFCMVLKAESHRWLQGQLSAGPVCRPSWTTPGNADAVTLKQRNQFPKRPFSKRRPRDSALINGWHAWIWMRFCWRFLRYPQGIFLCPCAEYFVLSKCGNLFTSHTSFDTSLIVPSIPKFKFLKLFYCVFCPWFSL